jgi:hypothetical protein
LRALFATAATVMACAAAPVASAFAGPAAATASPQPAAPADSTTWLRVDSAAKTAHLDLETAPTAGGLAAISGGRDGNRRIVVPLNWTVTWRWHSADSTQPHSLVVMAEREKLPEQGGRPALTNAMTRMVTAGLRAGQIDETSFVADQAGWYWLLCGVPTHALKGEWIGLRVDPDAKTASVVEVKR